MISENQSAFIRGRQILDEIIILNEVIHEAKWWKKECFIFKIDLKKAYDSVNWDFLDEMMWLFNFSNRCRHWIRECVSTTSILILVNGYPTSKFKAERGLRQGDPLSSFLYFLVA